jgi:hypothetical protein
VGARVPVQAIYTIGVLVLAVIIVVVFSRIGRP